MKFCISLFAAGALALVPNVVERDASGLAVAQAALSSVIAANRGLQTTIAAFRPTDGVDNAADAIQALYTAINDGTTNISAISVLSDNEAYQLANLVPDLTGSTEAAITAAINAKPNIDQACLGTLTYQVFGELEPLASAFAAALRTKVSTALQSIVDNTGSQIQTQLQRGQTAYADQFPAPCQCADGCGSSSTTLSSGFSTTSSASVSAVTSVSLTAGSSAAGGWVVITGTTSSIPVHSTTSDCEESSTTKATDSGWKVITSATTSASVYETTTSECDDETTTTKATGNGWVVITGTTSPNSAYATTTKVPVYSTTSDDCEDDSTTTKATKTGWQVISKSTTGGNTHSTTTTTKKSGSGWEVITTTAGQHTTTNSKSGWQVYTTQLSSGKPSTSQTRWQVYSTTPNSDSGWHVYTTQASSTGKPSTSQTGWQVVTTTPQAPVYTTPKAPNSSWVVITSKLVPPPPPAPPANTPPAVPNTTPHAPATNPNVPVYTTSQVKPPATTTQAPVTSYTTKAPVPSYTGAANAGAAMNFGAIILAAGAVFL